jgi:hypothetical protein
MKKLFKHSNLSNSITLAKSAQSDAKKVLAIRNERELFIEFSVYKKRDSWIDIHQGAHIAFVYDIAKVPGHYNLHFHLNHEDVFAKEFVVNIGNADCLPKKTIIKHLIKSLLNMEFNVAIMQFKSAMREALPNVNFDSEAKEITEIFDQYMEDDRIETSEELEEAFDEVIVELGQA